MSKFPKKGRPTVLTEQMKAKIVKLKETYKDNITYTKIGEILQVDFGLEKPIHHFIVINYLKNYKKSEEVKAQPRDFFEAHNKSKKIFQNIDLLKQIKIELIDVNNLLFLFDPLNTPKNLKWIICGDFQIPFHSRECVDQLIEFVEKKQPHLIVFNGDVNDFYCFSKYDKKPHLKNETALYNELKLEVEIYHRINKVSPNTKIIKKIRGSNHEKRYYKYMYMKSPEVADFSYLEKHLHDVAYEENMPIRLFISERIGDYLGDMVIKHEGYLIKTGIYKNIENSSYSCAVNHSHRLGIIINKMKDDGKIQYSLECGCMCKDPQGYRPDVGIVRGFVHGIYDTENAMLHPQIKVLEDKV